VISSDLAAHESFPHDGLLEMYKILKDQGFSDAEVAQMSKANPAKLLASTQ